MKTCGLSLMEVMYDSLNNSQVARLMTRAWHG